MCSKWCSLVWLMAYTSYCGVYAQQRQATPPAPAPTPPPSQYVLPPPIHPYNYRTPAATPSPLPVYNVQPTHTQPIYNHVLNRSAHCDEHQFHFSVQFALPFFGKIYAQNAPHCTFVGGEADTYSQQAARSNTQFSIQLPLTAACGTEQVDQHDYRQFSVGVRIEDGVNAAFMLVCRHRKVSTTTTPHSTPDVSYQIRPPTEEVLTHTVNLNDEASVRFDSRIVFGEGIAGRPVDRTVELGERLTFAFRCSTTPSNTNAYNNNNQLNHHQPVQNDCGVAECTARGQSGNVVQLTDNNGCTLHPPFWSDFREADHSKPGERVFYSPFWAWGLHSDVHMTIKCRLRICNGQCAAYSCADVVRPEYGHAQVEPNHTPNNNYNNNIQEPSPQPHQQYAQQPQQPTYAQQQQSGYAERAYDEPMSSVYETGTELSLQTAAIYEVDAAAPLVEWAPRVTVCLQQSLFTSLTALWLTVLFILVLSNVYSYYRLRKMMRK